MRVTHTVQTKKISKEVEKTKQSEPLSNWQKLINGIVRPPRSVCKDPLKKVKTFRMNETNYNRFDYEVTHQTKKLKLGVFDPDYMNGWVILYLHGNSSSRVEAYSIREYLPFRYSLACFDFMGCGENFEEDIITLGYRESQQAETIVDFLNGKNYKVIIWGRSMGAATALLYGKAPAIVADSAFKSFEGLCKQVAKRSLPCCLPACLVSCMFPCVFCKIRLDVEKRADYDTDCLDIKQAVKKICPQTLVIFLSGDEDVLIDKRNSVKLHEMFAGQNKQLFVFKGNHNSKRPPEVMKKVMQRIHEHLHSSKMQGQGATTSEHIKDTPAP